MKRAVILKAVFLLASMLPVAAPTLSGAELTVPHLEMASFGSVEDGEYVLKSVARADISVEGGYKYGALLRLAFVSGDLEKALSYGKLGALSTADPEALADRLNNQAVLGFSLAKVSARSLFGAPLDFTYFIGNADIFCSGDDFSLRFGTLPIGSAFRGFSYFPSGIKGNPAYQYDGIHALSGTGISLALTPWERFIPMVYLYQDASFIDETTGMAEQGRYSSDFRIMANGDLVKFEAFGGVTFPYGDYGLYRGGVLAFFSTGTGADFLAQVGVPSWSADEAFNVDKLYFLFEPRLSFGPAALHVTLFYHPLYYLNQKNPEEQGATDVNVKLLIGDLFKGGVEGGIETTMGIRTKAEDTFAVRVSPFLGIATDGVRWDFKVRIDPMAYGKPIGMFETYIGVRTAY